MTYERLFDLKYNQGVSTYELVCRFPEAIKLVNEVAMLEIPDDTLDEVLQEKGLRRRLKHLKKRLMKIQND